MFVCRHLACLILEGVAGNVERTKLARCPTSARKTNKQQCKQLILSISALMPDLGLMRLKIKKGLLPWRYRHHTNTPYHVQRAKTNQPIDYKDHGNPTTHECVNPSTQNIINSSTQKHQPTNSQTQKHQSTNSKTSTHKLKNINPRTQKTSTYKLKNSSIHELKKHQPTNSKNHQLKNSSTQKLKNSSTPKITSSSTHKLKNSKT